MTDMMIDRRDLLQRASLLLGGALSSGAVMGVLSGCAATPGASQPRFFTAPEMGTTVVMAELIIPRTTTPGASDLGVPGFIDRVMADFYPAREQAIMRAGLARADADGQAAHGKPFKDLDPAQQTALMTAYDREAFDLSRQTAGQTDPAPHFFRLMKELTTVGFFTSKIGASEILAYAAVPGPLRYDIPYSDVGRGWAT